MPKTGEFFYIIGCNRLAIGYFCKTEQVWKFTSLPNLNKFKTNDYIDLHIQFYCWVFETEFQDNIEKSMGLKV